MRRLWTWILVGAACLALWPVLGIGGAGEKVPSEPGWLQQMDPADPAEQTILVYWERFQRGELEAHQIVDLGTMLYERGLNEDALRAYRAALEIDPRLPEAWFRIGLVKHGEGLVDDARYAYKRCLKLLIGHGWCNFYLGLLEEQSGRPSKALHFYRRAFKVAPELADEDVNPALVFSDLYVGAELQRMEADRGTERLPMGYLEPDRVAEARSRPVPAPPAAARRGPEEARPSGEGLTVPIASPEALLAPIWSDPPSWILALL